MKVDRVQLILLGSGFLILAGASIFIGKGMQAKPFKISHVSEFYYYFSFYGTTISLVALLAIGWAACRRIPWFLAPMFPTLLFPFVFWIVYQSSFFLSGHEVGFDRGDLSPLTSELALAHMLIKTTTIGICVALVPAVIASVFYSRWQQP
jgi:hypothetical protein